MPFTQNNALLGGMGLACILGGVIAFKKKATTPFKMAYFGAWTIGGPATILLLSPDDKSMEERLRKTGLVDDETLKQHRVRSSAQMDALRNISKNERVP